MSAPGTEFVTCACNHCEGQIEFSEEQAGTAVECPHCGMETILFVPHTPAPPRAVAQVSAPPVVASDQGEACFFNERGIIVTKTRFMVAGQLFAMSNISSVRLEQIPTKSGGPTTLIVIGALVLLVSMVSWPAWPGLILAVLSFALAFYWFSRLKSSFRIVLQAAGGEMTGYVTKDDVFIMRVVAALNSAIIARG